MKTTRDMSEFLYNFFPFNAKALQDDKLGSKEIYILALLTGRRRKLGWDIKHLVMHDRYGRQVLKRSLDHLIKLDYVSVKEGIYRPITYSPLHHIKALRTVIFESELSEDDIAIYLRIQSFGMEMKKLSIRRISDAAKESRKTIQDQIDSLEEIGYLRLEQINEYHQKYDLYTGDDMWF